MIWLRPRSTLFPYTSLFRSVGNGLVVVLSVQPGSDLMIEREGVPGEPSARLERRGDALERAATVGPGRQVQERPERRSEEHTYELQSLAYLVCRLLLEKKKK